MNVLVIAAHPDDEILGCGATMARHAADGNTVNVVILAEGITSREDGSSNSKSIAGLKNSAKKANDIVGVSSLTLLSNPDNKLDSLPLLDVVKQIEAQVFSFKPDVIYTHFAGDLNVDHQVTYQAVMTACRPVATPFVKNIFCFEVPSSTEWAAEAQFSPNYYVNVTNTLDKKMQALNAYESEMRPWPHPRSIKAIEHLTHWRGATVGYEAAEAFILARGTR